MKKMDKPTLNKAVKEFIKCGEVETANYLIMHFGSQIEDYDIEDELKRIEKKPKQGFKIKEKKIEKELEE
jgi:hypothetical protein